MKTFKVILLLGVAAAIGAANAAAADVKIAYLDSQVILSKLKETKDVEAKLNELYKAWEKEAQAMKAEIDKKQEDFEAKSLMLTEKAKAERAQEIQTLLLQLRQFEQDKLGPEGEYFKERQRLLQPVIDKVQEMINKIGEEEGYDYIFDTANGNIVFAGKNQVNLTERIIQELEKQSSASSSSGKTN